MKVRFAPSPTGNLHIGGARTALFNYLLAKKHNGTFILRIDDTDKTRSKTDFEQDICDSLHWLGIKTDLDLNLSNTESIKFIRQSDRIDRHKQVSYDLVSKGSAYYDAEGAVRLKYPQKSIVIDDIICGQCVFSPKNLGTEPVILRQDETPTYHLASVVDDVDMGVTHVIRGQDHLTNTAKQVLIFNALESRLPIFAHLPLILGMDGQKLSKRNSEGLADVSQFKASGYLPQAIVNFLLLLGWSHPQGKEQISIEEAVKVFSLERVGKTASIFDVPNLDWLNAWWIKHMPVKEIAVEALQFTAEYRELILQRGERYWLDVMSSLRDELRSLKDAKVLAKILVGEEFEVSECSRVFLKDNKETCVHIVKIWLKLLQETTTTIILENPSYCYNTEQSHELIGSLKKHLGIKGRHLFQTLRIIITGEMSGPKLQLIIPFIHRNLLLKRVQYICDIIL